jgi:hypothetical protein
MSINNEKVKDYPVIIEEDVPDIEKSVTAEVTDSSPHAQYITPPDGGRGWLVVFASFMVSKKKKKKKKKKIFKGTGNKF